MIAWANEKIKWVELRTKFSKLKKIFSVIIFENMALTKKEIKERCKERKRQQFALLPLDQQVAWLENRRKKNKLKRERRGQQAIERENESKRRWRERNKDEQRRKDRESYLTNRDQRLKRQKEYAAKNPEKIKDYYRKNKKSICEKARVRHNQRRKKDPAFRILVNCRNRLRKVLKGISKSKTTTQLIGCSPEGLKEYLENKFTPEMSWENYGSYWHIDHIIPCCSFNLLDPEEQLKCFNYTNLQPLEASQNLKKNRFIL